MRSVGELLAQSHAVDARLPFQRQHAVDAHVLQPGHQQRHVAVGVDDRDDCPISCTRGMSCR